MQDLVEHLSILLAERNWKVAFAESCTGGLLAAAITHRPGSSSIFDRGFAVSAETAEEMAKGALKNSLASLTISITGIAGPDGGSEEKPVGLVHFGYTLKGGSSGSSHEIFDGTREQIRSKAAKTALQNAITILNKYG